jgi:hypothetical protein
MFQHAAHHTFTGGDVACKSNDKFSGQIAQGDSSWGAEMNCLSILMSFPEMSTFAA